MRRVKKLNGQFISGMTLVEVMIAMGILMPSLAGLGAAMWKRQQATVKIRGVNQMVAVHSAFMQAVNSELSYSEAQIAGMKDGNWPAGGVTLTLTSDTFPAAINFAVDTAGPTTMCINQNGAVCACAGFGANCPVRFEAQARTVAGGRFQFAYRVSGHESLGPMPPLGAPPRPGNGFDLAPATRDFSHYLPEKIYRFSVNRFCEGNNVALAGLVRDTGQEVCLRAADGINAPEACPAGQLPKEFVSVGGVLTFRCTPLPTAACNDPNFVMQVLNPAVLDSGGGLKGQCRMVTRQLASYPALGAGLNVGSISGQVCPPYYISQSSCNVIETKSFNGACPTWNMVYQGEHSVPMATGTRYYRDYEPVSSGTVTEPAKPGAAVFVQSGRNVTKCELTIPAQKCGAIWQGRVELVPSCVLEVGYQSQRPGN